MQVESLIPLCKEEEKFGVLLQSQHVDYIEEQIFRMKYLTK